eukprot:COSAG04_NODE_159_length_22103_cov_21.289389_12_plen_138_part_00
MSKTDELSARTSAGVTKFVTMAEAKLDSALDLMRRMPPADVSSHLSGAIAPRALTRARCGAQIEDNLYDLLDVAPDLTEDLLGSVDQPLKTCMDPKAGKEFLLCDYNRDADFYRCVAHTPVPRARAAPEARRRRRAC